MKHMKKIPDEHLALMRERFEIVGGNVVARRDYGGPHGNYVKKGEIAGSVYQSGYRYIGVGGRK